MEKFILSNSKSIQTNYQQWDLKSFDEILSPSINTDDNNNQQINLSIIEQEINLARDQGYQNGFEQGYADGLIQGTEQGTAKATQEALQQNQQLQFELRQQFDTLINQYQTDLIDARENIAQQILLLSLDLAQAMVKTALTVQPELVVNIIKQAINNLPYLQLPAKLYINPIDAELLNQSIGDELTQSDWKIILDTNIAPGGCKINTATNQIDATIANRWQYLQLALGQNTDWLKFE